MRRAAVAAVTARTGAGYCADDAGVGVDRPQTAALALENVNGAVCRHFDSAGAENARRRRGPAVAAVLRLAGSSEGRNRPCGEVDDAHPVVGDIGDK